MSGRDPGPARWALWFLRVTLPDDAESGTIVGDLIEEYESSVQGGDPRGARRRFVTHAAAVGTYAARDRLLAWMTVPGRDHSNRGDGTVTRFLADMRIAFRSLRRAPGFTVVAGVGLVIGLVGSLALTRVLESLLYGTSANDPLTFAATSFVLLLVGALASYIPARRASGIDPMEALRAE